MEQVETQARPPAVVKNADELAAAGMFAEIRTLIIQHKKDYLGLKINGTTDVKGFERMDEARKVLVKTRTKTDKIGKLMSADLVRRKKINDSATKEILDELKPIEDYVKGEVQKYKDDVEAEMAEEKRKADERNENRFNQLRGLGFRFDTTMKSWTATFMGQDVVLGMADIIAMGDEGFVNLYDEVSVKFQQEQQRQVDERQAQVLAKKQKEEQLAELKRQIDEKNAELAKLSEATPVGTALALPTEPAPTVVEHALTPDECFTPEAKTIDEVILDAKKAPLSFFSSSRPVGPAATDDNPFGFDGPSKGEQAIDAIKLHRMVQNIREIRYPEMESLEGVAALDVIRQKVNDLIKTIECQANEL